MSKISEEKENSSISRYSSNNTVPGSRVSQPMVDNELSFSSKIE